MKKIIINTIRIIVLIVACGYFTFASYNLTKSFLGYKNDDKVNDEINNIFMRAEDEIDDEVETEENQTDKNKEKKDSNSIPGYNEKEKKWVWDFDAIKEFNPESVGYIKLNDSRIQYPIVQTDLNDYYLNHSFNRTTNGNGAIFVDSRIQGGLDSQSCIVYGHDMMDGSMFAGLLKYKDADFCKNHQVYDIYVGYRHYRYYVFSSFRIDAKDEEIYRFGFVDDQDYQGWIDKCKAKSTYNYEYGVPDTTKKTIMLSTCVNNYDLRHVVCLYRGEEVVD